MSLDQWLFWWVTGIMAAIPWRPAGDSTSLLGLVIRVIGYGVMLVAFVGAVVTYNGWL